MNNKAFQIKLKAFFQEMIAANEIHPDDVNNIAYDIRIHGYVDNRIGRAVGMIIYETPEGMKRNKDAILEHRKNVAASEAETGTKSITTDVVVPESDIVNEVTAADMNAADEKAE